MCESFDRFSWQVVLSEPKRQYDMNEFERMLRMNEQAGAGGGSS